jgi:hypothetical protein
MTTHKLLITECEHILVHVHAELMWDRYSRLTLTYGLMVWWQYPQISGLCYRSSSFFIPLQEPINLCPIRQNFGIHSSQSELCRCLSLSPVQYRPDHDCCHLIPPMPVDDGSLFLIAFHSDMHTCTHHSQRLLRMMQMMGYVVRHTTCVF